ncbi:MAG: ornithine carbamoyltransferase [Candidatus Micrarchaeota archaeon]|nr:ornithine carbamoyltransferase [Candidatus Micrarchaeota archaeon]
MGNLLSVWELGRKEVEEYVRLGLEVKKNPGKYANSLEGKTLAMIFEKASTRTRVSFEVGMTQLGGHAIYFDFTTTQLSRGETMHDTAKTLGRYVDIIMARLYKHSDLLEIAKHAGVPVINGLTDAEHPCQALSDLQTISEKGKLKKGAKFAFVGDCGFNMANSLMLACAKAGMEVALVCPKAYSPNPKYLSEAKRHGKVEVINDPAAGVKDADVIYTDTWISMGLEGEKAERMKAFMPYQVNGELLSHAKKDCIVMHCLPAHRGLEITDEVIDGKQSVVWDQAENRLHMQKAIMLRLLGKI